MKNRKGVYFSFDAIIASVIFILTLISLLSYWYGIRETIFDEDSNILEDAIRISNLVSLPSNGEFGFANSYEDKSINLTKVEDYANLINPAELKEDVSTPFNLSISFEVYDSVSALGSLTPDVTFDETIGVEQAGFETQKVVRIYPTDDGRIVRISVFLYG